VDNWTKLGTLPNAGLDWPSTSLEFGVTDRKPMLNLKALCFNGLGRVAHICRTFLRAGRPTLSLRYGVSTAYTAFILTTHRCFSS